MNPTAAAWVRAHAWTEPVRAEAKHSHTILGPACLCQRPFTTAACAGDSCTSCEASPTWTAESVLIGPRGWLADLSRPKPSEGQCRWVWLWLADRTCAHRCNCSCHGAAPTAPVQLDLFGVAA
ncbi:hypothetical protein [Streptomyces sp. AMCC400023]|uniref:hypothetical protein n=1 Tax=Streptomyces sp. AMCC400023 TaxID=2056258 RepID=UPI001F2F08FF|nr:hypothetical protein [Streptomyces sp. AMCC400023]UJV43829.1 hypothetical protein CVT30_31940 [Streptomyces sp. AMCC400023]